MATAVTLQLARDRYGRESEVYEWTLAAGEAGDPLLVAARRSDKTAQVLLGSSTLNTAAVAWQGTLSAAAIPPAADWEPLRDPVGTPLTHSNNGQAVVNNFVQYRPVVSGGDGGTVVVCRLLVTGAR